jgi:Putative peptidoglycan binding domain
MPNTADFSGEPGWVCRSLAISADDAGDHYRNPSYDDRVSEMCATCTEKLEIWMRTLILATASAIALGIAGVSPTYAADSNTGGNPAAAATQTPATGTMQPATPQAGSQMQQTAPSLSGNNPSLSGNSRSNNPDMANSSPANADWPRVSRDDVQQIQQKLQQDGLYRGKIDGLVGPGTQQALSTYQRKNGLPVTATLDPQTVSSLNGAGVGSSTPPNSSNDTNMTPNETNMTPSSNAGTSGVTNPSKPINQQ